MTAEEISDLKDLISQFLFEGIHGDSIVLTSSSRARIEIRAYLVLDYDEIPLDRLGDGQWRPGSTASLVTNRVKQWCEQTGDQLSL